MPAPNQDRGRK
jgi:hypothetical protein